MKNVILSVPMVRTVPYRAKGSVPEATEHPKSRVFDQAENRLHAQKALLYHLMGGMKPRW